MLALAALPDRYRQWNDRHGAPFGRPIPKKRVLDYLRPPKSPEQLRGPFSIQLNNTTREFEYPWAFESARPKPGMRVVDLGGSLCGFQFALDQSGCQVVNVDPGMESQGWPCDPASMKKLNSLFGTHVELRNTTVENANLENSSIDCAFSISVLEHLTDTDIATAMKHVYRSLKPGGLFILTTDLFLNLHPFCSRTSNEFGRNQNVRWMIELEHWELVQGCRHELFGFESFNTDAILSNLEKYLIGRYYPVMVQCFVLKKRLTSSPSPAHV
jgi:ubiquinone/menaquinone biosynthesis C-methylase UbiE